MAITKTANGTYRLRMYIPEEVRPSLGINSKNIEKRFKNRSDAKEYELEMINKIDRILKGEETDTLINVNDITFSEFYKYYWWEPYKAGQTTSAKQPPTRVTIENTELIFRKHLLPILGNYSIKYLNNNKLFMLNFMTTKANEYANFRTLRSYVNSIFDWAEELEIIETNRLSKTLKRVKATKKIRLDASKNKEDLYLSHNELEAWLKAINDDLSAGYLCLKDYVLFYTTFFLGDRKSETYALQWKHIDFKNCQIHLVQALDKKGNIKSTKGNKKTIFNIPIELVKMLQSWHIQQKQELAHFNIIQTEKQLVFTYIDTKGNVNKALHIDYLNHRMKAIMKRHPELTHATPHKLRHTGATLAKQAGIPLEQISEALTHSDSIITQTYVNTANIIPMAVGEIAYRNLKK